MSRRNRIRWNKTDEKELSKLVKNFNAKRSRLIKKDPNLKFYLPDRVSKREIKQMIETRADLKKQMNSLKRFMVRGAEKLTPPNKEGYRITQYEKKEVGIQLRTINRMRTLRKKQLDELEVMSRNIPVGYKNIDVNRIKNIELKPKTFNFNNMTRAEFQYYKKGLQKFAEEEYFDKKDAQLLENYFSAMRDVFGDTNEVKEIEERIKKMGTKGFIKKFYSDTEARIEFIYDPIQARTKLDILKNEVWA